MEPLGSSDHNMVLCDLNFKFAKSLESDKSIKRQFNYAKANWLCFQEILQNANWNYVFNAEDVNVIWSRFSGILSAAMNYAIPTKKNRRKKKFLCGQQKQWETLEVREARRMRNFAERNYLQKHKMNVAKLLNI